jgi:hydrogenase-4 component B
VTGVVTRNMAPGPVSALMPGAMVNLGIYGIVRVGAGLLGGGVL